MLALPSTSNVIENTSTPTKTIFYLFKMKLIPWLSAATATATTTAASGVSASQKKENTPIILKVRRIRNFKIFGNHFRI